MIERGLGGTSYDGLRAGLSVGQATRVASTSALRTRLLASLGLGLSLGALACAQGDDSGGVAAASNELRRRGADTVAWSACPSDFLDQCAWLSLPLDHDACDSESLPIFISRRLARSGRAHTQLWLLQGGPGGSGNVFKGFIDSILEPALPDVDFYVLEHRGVGESARLGCPDQESPNSELGRAITPGELPACVAALQAQWGDALAHFSITADAHDLASAIERTREPRKRVLVYGLSYGSARALRFLQTHPRAADGVILDSIATPGQLFVSDLDRQLDPVAQDLAKLCAADPVCGAKLGPDPWARMQAIMQALEQGHCSAFTRRDFLRRGDLLPGREERIHLLALLYRLDRCEPEDVQVVERYFDALLSGRPVPGSGVRDSTALMMNVTFSELWPDPAPSVAELATRCAGQVFCPGVGVALSALQVDFPRYPLDRYYGASPRSRTPVLMLHGELDTQTPLSLAQALASELDARHQTLVTIPYGTHAAVLSSPVRTPGAPSCGTQLLASFVKNPRGALDRACLDDLVAPFELDPQLKQHLFGDADLWENAPTP